MRDAELRAEVAKFLGCRPEELMSSYRIALNSLRLQRLLSVLERRSGVAVGNGEKVGTFADLVRLFSNESQMEPQAGLSDHRQQLRSVALLGLGFDIEPVSSFKALNRATDPLVTRTFSEEELEHCYGQTEPAPHLAARFCAKEAAIKADPSLLRLPLTVISLRLEAGRPVLVIPGRQSASYMVTLSHTDDIAGAVVALVAVSPSA